MEITLKGTLLKLSWGNFHGLGTVQAENVASNCSVWKHRSYKALHLLCFQRLRRQLNYRKFAVCIWLFLHHLWASYLVIMCLIIISLEHFSATLRFDGTWITVNTPRISTPGMVEQFNIQWSANACLKTTFWVSFNPVVLSLWVGSLKRQLIYCFDSLW